MARLSIRVDFEPTGSSLGPGMVDLLENISSEGSIRGAATAMNMSYRKAWELIQAIEKTFDGPIVDAAVGGASGGGARLTDRGERLLLTYRHLVGEAERAAEHGLSELSLLVRTDAAPKRKQRRPKGAAGRR